MATVPPPTTVHIAPYELELHFDEARLDKEGIRGRQAVWGYVNTLKEQVMGVDPTLSEAGKRVTVLHELLHAVMDASGYGHPKKIKDLEQYLNVLANGLLGLLRTNHQLVAWLADMGEAPDADAGAVAAAPAAPLLDEQSPVLIGPNGLGKAAYPRAPGAPA